MSLSTPRRWAGWSASTWYSWSRPWCWRCPTAGAAITSRASSEWRIANREEPPFAIRHSLFARLYRFPRATEFLRRLVEHEQRALLHAEIGAVQLQLAALGDRPDERKSHQVFQAAEHGRLLDPD